jgi:uncharacterized membrane protein YjjP (DUF1212 family)
MEENFKARLDAQEQKLEAIYQSVEKTRKYLLIIMWGTVAMFVLPLVIALIIVPILINSYTNTLNSLM